VACHSTPSLAQPCNHTAARSVTLQAWLVPGEILRPPLTGPGSTSWSRPSSEWTRAEYGAFALLHRETRSDEMDIMREEGPRPTTSHDVHHCIPAVPVLRSLARLRNRAECVLRVLAESGAPFHPAACNDSQKTLRQPRNPQPRHRLAKAGRQPTCLRLEPAYCSLTASGRRWREGNSGILHMPARLATAILGRASVLPVLGS
jgi:hypothetical protein